jgi:hypothetical protein
MCQQPKPNPECLQVLKVNKDHLRIVDLTDSQPSVVYDGTPDIDCMLDALAIHFGFEGTEIHEIKTEGDPNANYLDKYSKDSLDNRTDKKEVDIELVEVEDGECSNEDCEDCGDDCCSEEIPEEDYGIPDWDDDWEDEQ